MVLVDQERKAARVDRIRVRPADTLPCLSACPPLNPCNQPQPPLRDCVKIMDKNGCVSQREREREKWDEAVLDSCFG